MILLDEDALSILIAALEDTQPLLAANLKDVQITNQTMLADLGITSVALYEISGYIEDKLDIVIATDQVASLRTIGDLAKMITSPA